MPEFNIFIKDVEILFTHGTITGDSDSKYIVEYAGCDVKLGNTIDDCSASCFDTQSCGYVFIITTQFTPSFCLTIKAEDPVRYPVLHQVPYLSVPLQPYSPLPARLGLVICAMDSLERISGCSSKPSTSENHSYRTNPGRRFQR